MNLHQFYENHTRAERQVIAEKAGTSLFYLNLCKYGDRRMSAELAIWMEWASNGEMTAYELRPDLPWPGQPRDQVEVDLFSAATRKNRRPLKPRNEQAADRDNDPPLMPAPNRESRHASHAENPMQR